VKDKASVDKAGSREKKELLHSDGEGGFGEQELIGAMSEGMSGRT